MDSSREDAIQQPNAAELDNKGLLLTHERVARMTAAELQEELNSRNVSKLKAAVSTDGEQTTEYMTKALLQHEDLLIQYPKVMFGLGCYFGTQPFFEQVKGVLHTNVGYSGTGMIARCGCMVQGGPNEVVRLAYDPKIVTLQQLIWLFFVVQDHTDPFGDVMGDCGRPHYRSEIVVYSSADAAIATKCVEAYKEDIRSEFGEDKERVIDRYVKVLLQSDFPFVPAENRWQHFLSKPEGKQSSYQVLRPLSRPNETPYLDAVVADAVANCSGCTCPLAPMEMGADLIYLFFKSSLECTDAESEQKPSRYWRSAATKNGKLVFVHY